MSTGVAYAWQVEEQERIDEKISRSSEKTFTAREDQLEAIAREWVRVNPDHEIAVGDLYLAQDRISDAAFSGNDRANKMAGN